MDAYDVRLIVQIADDLVGDIVNGKYKVKSESGYYEEVLRRYEKIKKEAVKTSTS